MNSGMILENTIPPFSIGNHFWYVTMYNAFTPGSTPIEGITYCFMLFFVSIGAPGLFPGLIPGGKWSFFNTLQHPRDYFFRAFSNLLYIP